MIREFPIIRNENNMKRSPSYDVSNIENFNDKDIKRETSKSRSKSTCLSSFNIKQEIVMSKNNLIGFIDFLIKKFDWLKKKKKSYLY